MCCVASTVRPRLAANGDILDDATNRVNMRNGAVHDRFTNLLSFARTAHHAVVFRPSAAQ